MLSGSVGTKHAFWAPIFALIALTGARGDSQGTIEPVNERPNPYQMIADYFKLPTGRQWGSTSAVDIDPDGRSIWVAERCGANSCAGSSLPVVMMFDPLGGLVRSFGANMFIFPHGIHVERDGDVWVADGRAANEEDLRRHPDSKGKGHAVYKFSPDGTLLMTLGRPGVAGEGPDTFNQPSDVITAPNGDIFVADGHGRNSNARIVKFSKDGKFIKAWGEKGSAPGEFDTPHALAFDSQGRLFVADRNNNRIQIFDQEGKFIDQWRQFGRPSGIFIDRKDLLYAADSESNIKRNPGWKRGIRVGSAKDGTVMYFIPDTTVPDPETAGSSNAEGVAADADGNIFAAEVGPQALKKYVKK